MASLLRNSWVLFSRTTAFSSPITSLQGCSMRQLYCKSALAIDNFIEQQGKVKNQMANITDRFKEKMTEYTSEEVSGGTDTAKNMIFTEDLKNMIHIADNDDDLLLVVKMMKRFNQQNKQLRFGSYIFGPVVMRLFHLHDKVDLAIQCFKSDELTGFFDQLMSYQILLDLLYEHGRYQQMLDIIDEIQQRQLEGVKYPKNIVMLAFAACYKLNTSDSWQHALKLWQNVRDTGHYPMRRATTFCAGLALNQNHPEATIEILSITRNPNYTTVRNLKVAALCDLGRLDDAIPILKSVLADDQPTTMRTIQTFNKDVIERVRIVVEKLDSAETSAEFSRLVKLFEQQGHISDLTLDEQLCMEIQKPPEIFKDGSSNTNNNMRQGNRFSRYNQNPNKRYDVYRNRPGLNDLV